MTDRPSWSDTWMTTARAIAARSRCDGRQVGAIIVSKDNAYSVVGYNGPPRGWDGLQASKTNQTASCSSWCPRRLSDEQTASYDNCISIHAEANALIKADYSRIEGGSLFVTSSICWDCGKLVANSRILRVHMIIDPERDKHRNPYRTIDFMTSSGLEVSWEYE